MPAFPILYEIHFTRGACISGVTKEQAHANAVQHRARAALLKLDDAVVLEGWADEIHQPTAGNPPANA